MPAMRRYRVVEMREVYVDAHDVVSAAQIAGAALKHGQDSSHGVAQGKAPEGVWGNTVTQIRAIDISATEE